MQALSSPAVGTGGGLDEATKASPPPPPKMDVVQFPYIGPQNAAREICNACVRKWYWFVVTTSLWDERRRRRTQRRSIGADEERKEANIEGGRFSLHRRP